MYYNKEGNIVKLNSSLKDKNRNLHININKLTDLDIFQLFGLYRYIEISLNINEKYGNLIFDDITGTCKYEILIDNNNIAELILNKKIEFYPVLDELISLILKCKIYNKSLSANFNKLETNIINYIHSIINTIDNFTTISEIINYEIDYTTINKYRDNLLEYYITKF